MVSSEFDCEYNVMCVEGPTCSAYMVEGRAFECKRSYQDVYDMEYKCDCQYTDGYKNWLKENRHGL